MKSLEPKSKTHRKKNLKITEWVYTNSDTTQKRRSGGTRSIKTMQIEAGWEWKVTRKRQKKKTFVD